MKLRKSLRAPDFAVRLRLTGMAGAAPSIVECLFASDLLGCLSVFRALNFFHKTQSDGLIWIKLVQSGKLFF
jgi:hypothetical protein